MATAFDGKSDAPWHCSVSSPETPTETARRTNRVSSCSRERCPISSARSNARRQGLNARYSRVAADAAFSLQALENSSSKKMGSQVDELTRSMAQSRSRLKALDAQLAFLHGLQSQVDDFVKKAEPAAGRER